jgi:hypothetical protein
MRVSVDEPGAGSTLFSQNLTAPGSNSSFAPLPAALFAGAGDLSAGVRTQFASLTFDPYATTYDPNSKGVTRLAFTTTSGDDIVVANLATPVKFSMPALASLADGVKASCEFYDTAARNYSTVGCVGIPDPAPANHVLEWVPGFTVSTDAEMAAAWNISGPLVDGNCSFQLLDCSLPNPPVVFPNPAKPFLVPGVACDKTIDTLPKLVFVGSRCRLIDPNNEERCSWDNSKQAFVGPGCVASGEPVQCACRHRASAPLRLRLLRCDFSDTRGCASAQSRTLRAPPSLPSQRAASLTVRGFTHVVHGLAAADTDPHTASGGPRPGGYRYKTQVRARCERAPWQLCVAPHGQKAEPNTDCSRACICNALA